MRLDLRIGEPLSVYSNRQPDPVEADLVSYISHSGWTLKLTHVARMCDVICNLAGIHDVGFESGFSNVSFYERVSLAASGSLPGIISSNRATVPSSAATT